MRARRLGRGSRGAACVVAAGLAVLPAGCGGGERQDADEADGSFTVEVVDASFPRTQGLGQTSPLRVTVRNTGREAVPLLALTVEGLADREAQPAAADPSRPLWIVDDAKSAGRTAYVDTWTLGPLPAGESKTFEWTVTAVVPGTHTLRYRVAAGLDGRARARTADGAVPEGSLTARVTRRPRETRVDPRTGEVIYDTAAPAR